MIRSTSIQPRKGKLRVLITKRENEVLQLISQGNTDIEIGSILFLFTNTIKSYRMRLLSKFDAKNAAHLVFIAMSYLRNYFATSDHKL